MYRDKMISDWNKVNLKSPEGQRLFLEAAEHFLRKPAMKTTRLRGKSQEFTTPSDFPQSAVDAIAKFSQVDAPDTGWERIFEVVDFTSTSKNGFEILDVGTGLSFRAIKPGEKAEVFKVSGDVIPVNFDLFGGALALGVGVVAFEDGNLGGKDALEVVVDLA